MKIAIVDIQAFYIENKLRPKEITIKFKTKRHHFLLDAPYNFTDLSPNDRKTVVTTQKYHGIKYSASRYVDYNKINIILNDHLSDVDVVYVRGNQKYDYLMSKAWELDLKINVVDVAKFDSTCINNCCQLKNPPKIEATSLPDECSHHSSLPARCTNNICEDISHWVYKSLPMMV